MAMKSELNPPDCYYTVCETPECRAAGVKTLRHIEPYIFSFKTHAKDRWIGRAISIVLTQEFGSFPEGYFDEIFFLSGRVTVNGEVVTPDYLLKEGDLVCHHTHRHEPPVSGDSIQIIFESDEVIVVNKPSSIPCHPCGAYRYNSLPYLLKHQGISVGTQAQNNLEGHSPQGLLHVVHRLDRLTSGVLILGKTKESARGFAADIQGGFTDKIYIARVHGKFETFDLSWKRDCLDEERGVGWCYQEIDNIRWIRVQQPIRCLSHKQSLFECAIGNPSISHLDSTISPSYKKATTLFRFLSFNGKTSVVECRPLTGRTHQIRLHLKFLNHPIANDPQYMHVAGSSSEHAPQDMTSQSPCSKLYEENSTPRQPSESLECYLVRTCEWCKLSHRPTTSTVAGGGVGQRIENRNQLHRPCLWLHASQYSSRSENSWSFSAPEPHWASESFVEIA